MDDFYVDKVLNGDREAFRYFIKKYKDIAYNLSISIVKNPHNAEDIVQESFIKVFKNLNTFKKNAQFSSWLYRIVVNEAFMFLRKNKISFTEINEQITKLASVEIEDNQKWELVQNSIYYLNPNEALALNLFYLEEKKISEISNITGWSKSNVKVILHRARKNIRNIISNIS